MKALSFGCQRAIRSRQDCVASREETRFSAIAFATAVSDIKAGSVLIATPLRLHQPERRRLQVERQRAGDRREAFEGRADRMGDARRFTSA